MLLVVILSKYTKKEINCHFTATYMTVNRKKINTKKGTIINDMTDTQLLRSIAQNMRTSTNLQRSIKGWVTFFGIMYILTIVGFIFINITS